MNARRGSRGKRAHRDSSLPPSYSKRRSRADTPGSAPFVCIPPPGSVSGADRTCRPRRLRHRHRDACRVLQAGQVSPCFRALQKGVWAAQMVEQGCSNSPASSECCSGRAKATTKATKKTMVAKVVEAEDEGQAERAAAASLTEHGWLRGWLATRMATRID